MAADLKPRETWTKIKSKSINEVIVDCEIEINIRLIWDYFSFSYLHKLFHKQGFTYDYVFDWIILKFGATLTHENEAKNRERKQWHPPTCAILGISGSRRTFASFDHYKEGSGKSPQGTGQSSLVHVIYFLINIQIDITQI